MTLWGVEEVREVREEEGVEVNGWEVASAQLVERRFLLWLRA